MPKSVVIIGAVALGPKAACRFKRLAPESRVIMVDQSDLISYGGCGIPYFISGEVSDPGQLQSTSFHMLRDEKFFREAKDIEVMTLTRAVRIDRAKKCVTVEGLSDGRREDLPYTHLVLATGSRPRRLPIPGDRLRGVFTVGDLNEAIAIKKEVAGGQVGKAVVIGAGAIGLEMAEALSDLWGIETCVVEIMDQILPGVIGKNIAQMAQQHLQEKGVNLYLGEKVLRLEGTDRVSSVVTEKRVLEADLAILAVGVIPNSDLAREAGLELTASGAIRVNDRMQTSDPDIYAGGDCVEIPNLVTGRLGYFPLGAMANRQGRVIGTNLAGGDARFEGAVGSFVIKLFDISAASSGMTLETAQKEGLDAVNAFVVQFDRAHFYPEKELLYLELVAERKTRRVLGIQGLGSKGDAMVARVNAVAAILKHRPAVEEISNLELPYSPPFSSAMDVLNALGNTAENLLEERTRVLDPIDFAKWWEERERGEVCFLDCRGWGNAEPFVKKYPGLWLSIPQDQLRDRMDEVPRDKRLVLICNTGVRSYEAQLMLDRMGVRESVNLQGGVAALKKLGLNLV
jgi:NADPH-dependent 2,4-dienoyl-CoA reductase/sulfur reductase-like enzyme/rhodanese-related sulfurtransferase